MGTPSTTARQTPTGYKPGDGYQTLIAFAADPDIAFWEKAVKPPGIDGGDAIETTTMHNTEWRSMAPRSLKTLTAATTRVTYDPILYTSILSLINVETSITVHFFDGATLDFFGYLKSFTPADLTEGTQPEADIEIVPTNTDPADSSEADPVYTTPAGTVL